MIDESVLNLASEFTASWTQLLSRCHKYRLDCSWPSVGMLDLILFPLFEKSRISDEERQLVNGAAAYLGGMAHDCWMQFPDKSEILLAMSQEGDVVLQAKGGKNLPSRSTFQVNINRTLLQILSAPSDPFPVMSEFARSVLATEGRVSLFAAGLFSGLCPYGEGAWRDLPLEKFTKNILAVENQLANSAALHYSTIYPAEFLGGFPQLYLSGQILPPLYLNEPVYGMYSVTELAKYLSGVGAEREELKTLLLNLSMLPEDRISVGPSMFAAALIGADPQLRFALAQRWDELSQLRGGVLLARTLLNEPSDWLKLCDGTGNDAPQYEVAEKLYNTDSELGLMPYLRLPSRLVREPLFFDLFRALAWSNLPVGRDISAHLLLKNAPHNFALMVQAGELDLEAGDLEACSQKLSLMKMALDKVSLEERLSFYELSGLLAIAKHQWEEARISFNYAIRNSEGASHERSAKGYLRALQQLQRHEDLIGAAEVLKRRYQGSAEIALVYVAGLVMQGRKDDADAELKRVLSKSPRNRAGFMMLMGLPITE